MKFAPHTYLSALLVGVALVCAGCTKDEKKAPPKPPPAVDDDNESEGDGADNPADGANEPADKPTTTIEIPKHREFAMAEIQAEFLDPNLVGESSGRRIASAMFEQLVVFAPGNPKPVPAQAESWTIEDDGRVYVFKLRKDAKWTDGKAITSADWMYSMERALNPKTVSRNAHTLWVIKNAQAYNKGDLTDFSQVGVSAPDAHTLRFELTASAPYFLDLLTYIAYSPTPKHAIDKHGKQWTRPENIVSNGPFEMKVWKQGDRIEMVKSDTYWDKDNVWLEKFVFYLTNSVETAHNWYEKGRVHWTPGLIPTERVKELLGSGRPDFRIDPILCTYYYVFNVKRAPFDDPKVRHAFNLALDKARLTRQVLGMGQKPASHLVPPHFKERLGYGAVRGDGYDPEKARAMLKEAGYGEGGRPFPETIVIYNTNEGHRSIAEFFQRSIKANLGVDVKIQNMEWKTLLKSAHSHDFQIARTSWCADFPDPENFVSVFHSAGENNYSDYENAELDAIIDELRKTGDQTKRNALAAKGEQILNRDQPMLPFYFYTRGYMIKPWVRGLEPNIMDHHAMKYIWFGAPGDTKP